MVSRRRLTAVLAGVALAGAWLWLLYELSWLVGYNSDDANAVLAGRDLIGNPLLRGWVLPGDPYWLTSLPYYGLGGALWGPGPTTMHAVPVLVVVAVVVAGWWMLGQGRDGPGRWIGAAPVVLLVALPHPVLAQFLLSMSHLGTTLACLVGAALVAHKPRRPAWWAGVLLLGAAVVSDPFAVTIGVLPVLCAGAAGAFRRRHWLPVASAAGAALLAGGTALAVRHGLRAVGGFGLAPALPLTPSSYRLDNLGAIPEILGALLGVGPAGGLSGVSGAAHAVGAALFVAGIAVAAGRLVVAVLRGREEQDEPGSSWPASGWIDDVLFAGVIGGLGTFVFVTLPPRDLGSARYLIPTMICGALLAGRQLGWVADRLAFRGRALAGVAMVALTVTYLGAALRSVDDPGPPSPAQDLVAWLAANDLHAGYAPYWTASIVTVESGGAIPVRPVVAVEGRLHGYLYYSTREWFGEDTRPGRWFVAYDPSLTAWGVDEHTARTTFGPPSMTAEHGPYRILVWDHDLSSQLGPPWRDPERGVARLASDGG